MAIGTNKPDNLSYDGSTDQTIYGLNGDDFISTVNSTANNTTYGGSGNDTINAGLGNDTIYGEKGADIISAGLGEDFIDGGLGDDWITTGEGNDTIVLTSTGGIDTVTDFSAVRSVGPDQTINFNGLSTIGLPIPNGHGGFNWGNEYTYYPDAGLIGTGFYNVGQGTNIAYDGYAHGGTIQTAGADFTLKSSHMGSGWFDQNVTVDGYDDGNLVASVTFFLDMNRNEITFNGFDSIDTVTIRGDGGSQVVIGDLIVAFETVQSQDLIQVASQAVADGLLASAHDVAGGVALDHGGYHTVLLGQTAADVTADWFTVA